MDVEYTWILGQVTNCRQFSLLTWNLFIGQFVHLVGREGDWEKGENHYFSPLNCIRKQKNLALLVIYPFTKRFKYFCCVHNDNIH